VGQGASFGGGMRCTKCSVVLTTIKLLYQYSECKVQRHLHISAKSTNFKEFHRSLGVAVMPLIQSSAVQCVHLELEVRLG